MFYLYGMALSQQLALTYIRTKIKLLSAISKKKAAAAAFALFCTPQYRNKKKLPVIFEKAEPLHLHFQKFNVHGYRWNAGQNNKVLILHGFESGAVNFDRYVKPLLKKGYEVLAFDAPAHGRSTGKQFNALLYKEFIKLLNTRYGPITRYMAHSLGGLAVSLALEEMPHDASYRAALIAPATETVTAVDSFFKYLKLPADLRPAFDAVIFKKSGQPPHWFSVSRAIKHVHATILWAHDKDDVMTPYSDAARVMDENYPNITFLITEGLGHRRIYRDNVVQKAVIDFL